MKVSSLLPDLFSVDPPTVDGKDPLIQTALTLKQFDVPMLAGSDVTLPHPTKAGPPLGGVYGSYGVLKKVATTEPKEFYKLLWTPASAFPTYVGSYSFHESLEEILGSFVSTRFGVVKVKEENDETLLTLREMVGLVRERLLTVNSTTAEVSSTPITISAGSSIIGAIRAMLAHNVRRLFLGAGSRDFVSDRSLIDHLFSRENLEAAKAIPEAWTNGTVSTLPTRTARELPSGNLGMAADIIGDRPDDCLMTDKGKVVSRWDIVVKPWKAGKLSPTT